MRTTAEVSQTHKPHSCTSLLLHETINSTHTRLSLALQALLRNMSASCPKSQHSTPYPRTTWKASLLSSAVTDMLKKKNVRCISVVLPSNPFNLEGIRIETWKKVWKLRGTLLCKEISSLRNTKLYFPQSSKN